jgi:hypothetical protein
MYLHPGPNRTQLSVEGDLTGVRVQELERCWRALGPDSRGELRLDVSRLDAVDQHGYALLAAMRGRGVAVTGLDPASGMLRTCTPAASWFTRIRDFAARRNRFRVRSVSRLR